MFHACFLRQKYPDAFTQLPYRSYVYFSYGQEEYFNLDPPMLRPAFAESGCENGRLDNFLVSQVSCSRSCHMIVLSHPRA